MNSDCNFYVFREGRKLVLAQQLLTNLRESLARISDEQSCIDALLRCGELQCALEDRSDPIANILAVATERCADALLAGDYKRVPEIAKSLPNVLPGQLEVSTPEGFAYYALQPKQYADVVGGLSDVSEAVVIGIRSIGTTLSAVTAAALRRRGANVVRFSVRPEGHPFDRTVQWNPEQLRAVREGLRRRAKFLIVDEGPGLSGSSFLSIAEALRASGVPKEGIAFIPSHQPDTALLRANDGAKRWNAYTCIPVPPSSQPEGAWIGAGEWRRSFLPDEDCWPGSWTTMERAKFLSSDSQVFWKFEGLGPYGTRSFSEAEALAERGFGPRVLQRKSGFLGYESIKGTALRSRDLLREYVEVIAAYCAFRAQNFSSEMTAAQQHDLETMLGVNFEREFGELLPDALTKLEVVNPVVCDAKMSPHEWLAAEDGRFLKFDATAHGDDHFFPGPCDIAWDLAGAIVEWEMDREARAAFLERYKAFTGDDASHRIAKYLIAYAMFRSAWLRMAASAMKGTADEHRLMHDYRRCRDYAEKFARVSVRG